MRAIYTLILACACVFGSFTRAAAQNHEHNMPGMTMGEHQDEARGFNTALLASQASSGTDAEPASVPSAMLMRDFGNWKFMLHGMAFIADIQQTGPRGGDKLFSANWVMPMAHRKLGGGTLTLRSMLSLEAATVTSRRYPELFQEGETAFGNPIIDGQHPHDFLMELAVTYDYPLGERVVLSFYGAPMGAPALGPAAFPHRASASENPLAPLGHHLQDSTHIAADVVTAGLTFGDIRVEASGFHGREPDESRWNLNSGGLDSWSVRATVTPGKNWVVQYSLGRLHSPEVLAPEEDIQRMTASVTYNRPLTNGNWASMLAWGRNSSIGENNVGNSYLLEFTLHKGRNAFWTRMENVDRTNHLLAGDHAEPSHFEERYFARVQAYAFGYGREVKRLPHLSVMLGTQVTAYGVPANLEATYGERPVGIVGFLRLRLF